METVVTPTPPVRPQVFSYAGFWKRFVAYIIDGIILGALELVIFLPLLGIIGVGALTMRDFDEPPLGFVFAFLSAYLAAIFLMVVAAWLYFALMESKKGATLGKMALGIIVTDMSGNMISFGRASGRYFAKIVSSLTLGIGYIIAGFTQQKQALHDILAGCLVINKSVMPR